MDYARKSKDSRPLKHLKSIRVGEKNPKTLAFETKTENNLEIWGIYFPKEEGNLISRAVMDAC